MTHVTFPLRQRGAASRRAAAAAIAIVALAALDARAVQRTFVSTSGSDANTAQNCSLAAPCRSFGSALTVTTAGGEIIVLDSGGYGRVAIDKSVTIWAPAGVYAGVSVSAGTNGVDIDTPGAAVVLRGLAINGQGGTHGVNATRFSQLTLEDCVISGMSEDGVRMLLASGSARATVRNSRIRDNGTFGLNVSGDVALHTEQLRAERNGLDGMIVAEGVVATLSDSSLLENVQNGVTIQAHGAGAHTRLLVSKTTFAGNLWGFFASGLTSGFVEAELADSIVTGNTSTGVRVTASGSAAALSVAVRDSTISRNGAEGVLVRDANARLVASRNTVVGNVSHGLAQTFASSLLSSGDNALSGNNGGGAQTLGVVTPLAGI
jgi:hypothetical protein